LKKKEINNFQLNKLVKHVENKIKNITSKNTYSTYQQINKHQKK